jgi:hypothetical protein
VTQQFKPTWANAPGEQSGEDEENNDVSSHDNFFSFSFSTNKPVPSLAVPHDVGTLLLRSSPRHFSFTSSFNNECDFFHCRQCYM